MPLRTPQGEHDTAVFRVRHPHIVAWCEAHDDGVGSWNSLLAEHGVLAPSDAAAIQNLIDLEDNDGGSGLPAQAWNARHIPNGDFRVTIRGIHFDFRIHLVERGQLAGKRIIKVKSPGSSIYTGFAFLTRNGGMDLWRRFQHHSNSEYVLAAHDLVANLNAFTDQTRVTSRSVHQGNALRDGALEQFEYRILRRRCFHCNAAVTATTAGTFFLCSDHSVVPPAPPTSYARAATVREPDPELERLLDEEEAVGRTVSARGAARRTRSSREAAQSRSTLLMSEVSGKYVR